MAKPWHEQPLWWKVYMRDDRIHLNAGKIIGHLGCGAFAFWDAVKLLPNYDKLRFENALRDLTVYEKRERGEYELHAHAKKVLWIIIGPPPDHPEYVQWWRGRLISVRQMQAEGKTVEWAECPPVPLPEEKPAEPRAVEPPKKRTRRRKEAG